MADEQQITRADLERLAGKLDGLDLSDDERDVLAGVFAAAGQRFAAGDDEVSGFGIIPIPPPSSKMSTGFMNTFQPTYKVSFPGRGSDKVLILSDLA